MQLWKQALTHRLSSSILCLRNSRQPRLTRDVERNNASNSWTVLGVYSTPSSFFSFARINTSGKDTLALKSYKDSLLQKIMNIKRLILIFLKINAIFPPPFIVLFISRNCLIAKTLPGSESPFTVLKSWVSGLQLAFNWTKQIFFLFFFSFILDFLVKIK